MREPLAPGFDRIRLLAGPAPQKSGTDPTAWLAARVGGAKGKGTGPAASSNAGSSDKRSRDTRSGSAKDGGDVLQQALDGIGPEIGSDADGREGNLSELPRC